ncbi:putative 2OG-Fe(II) oxygenase [Pontixanthobacter gangjinensis]
MLDGLNEHPSDASLWNSAGSLFMRLTDREAAEEHFAKAAGLQPDNMEFAVNRAIALSALSRHAEAVTQLKRFSDKGRTSVLYCSTRGTAERGIRSLTQAALWYDRALELEPARAKALHGRARVAIERGEDTALQRFDKALSVNQGDADLWLGKAQALDVAGDHSGARQIAEALVNQAPQWTEGLRFLAQLRLGQGEEDFTSHYGDAMKRVPQDPNIPAEWCSVLGGLDYNTAAADVAEQAQISFPEVAHFRLLEAVNAGAAGDNDRAEGIFARLEQNDSERWLHEARHRIRRAELDHASTLLDQVTALDPWSISAWALRGIVWRLTKDKRSAWLDGQDELVRLMPLQDADTILPKVIPLLHRLHDKSPLPLGQSLRGGSQTRGILFDRTEPELDELRRAVLKTVEEYRRQLPPSHPKHPLLRLRDQAWRLEGSWSVRLSGGGDFHTAHIHPQGIVSSALYLELPAGVTETADQSGWLEVGRPAADLGLDLGPLQTLEPKPGHMALFPSTLYHGTRPFSAGRRMTVAFDVSTKQGN